MKVVLIVFLLSLVALFEVGMQATIDECNRVDDRDNLVYKDSFICANNVGRRLTTEEVNCREFGTCNLTVQENQQ